MLVFIFAGFIKGFSGFATSIVLTGILVFFYEPSFLIPILALISMMLNILLFIEHFKYIKKVKNNFALRIETILALLVGTFIGVKLLVYLNVNIIKIILGFLILGFIYLIRHKFKRNDFIITKTWLNIIIGSVAGLFSGLINVNGPPVVLFGMYYHYNKIKLLKSIVIFFIIADLITIIVFYFTGLYTSESINLFLKAIPFVLLGFFGGVLVRKQCKDAVFKKYVLALLILIAAKLIFDGFMYAF